MKIFLRLLAAALAAAGLGLLVYGGIVDADQFRAPFGWHEWIRYPAEAVGWGAGFLGFGLGCWRCTAGRPAAPA